MIIVRSCLSWAAPLFLVYDVMHTLNIYARQAIAKNNYIFLKISRNYLADSKKCINLVVRNEFNINLIFEKL